MKIEEIKRILERFLPQKTIVKKVKNLDMLPKDIIGSANLSQILRLNNIPGINEDLFKYYFLERPNKHPYDLNCISVQQPDLHPDGIYSPEQLEWGLERLFLDSLLYFNSLTTAYSELNDMRLEEIHEFFDNKRLNSDKMKRRRKIIGFRKIPVDDRYLIGEMACKFYKIPEGQKETVLESELLEAYKKLGRPPNTPVKKILDYIFQKEKETTKYDQMALKFSSDEIMEDVVNNERDLKEKVKSISKRFIEAREAALNNAKVLLSVASELDVYVATSMRLREDFRNMAKNCKKIFNNDTINPYNLRYFDPTLSAAPGHEDKGLLECLMVKYTKVLIYFAGEKESFGKDSEAAMALSQGKPIIIVCPEGDKNRMQFFRDLHPLSRMIDFKTGIACGAIVTSSLEIVIELLKRIFSNSIKYKYEHDGKGYYRIREELTNSVIRLQTNNRMILDAQWELIKYKE